MMIDRQKGGTWKIPGSCCLMWTIFRVQFLRMFFWTSSSIVALVILGAEKNARKVSIRMIDIRELCWISVQKI